ncbi:MAG TPA: alpha-2-macroglobulin family protein [Thermoguttaceae bacterium]|nr:alpha-2-macroglobulin family protein [Thermoguttaceae bacterium]
MFAIADGHTASNVVGLQGVGIARGLSDKGYIYTDRPAYRAGQMVHVRGCLRHVEERGAGDEGRGDEEAPPPVPFEIIEPPAGPGPGPGDPAAGDVYLIEEGKAYTLEVFDGRSRLVRQEEVTLNAFGTFHAHFVLPTTSPQGEYRVLVRDEEGHSYQGSFQVHQYQLEPVRLVIDVPRNVYYRGEEIEGTIKAAYYYGAPLADREIRYQLADDRLHTATTDEKGEVKFKLPTREYGETQILPLVVTLPERNLQTAVNFVLASRGFSIGVSTLRPVYVAGETFETTVNTHDAEGKPVGRKLTLKVLEKTTVRGKVGERLVEEHPLETVEKDGSGRMTLKLAEGGRYAIRVEGTDRFNNPISGEYLVQISDDEDDVRLRILADTHTYKVGDTATVKLHWREEPALALVTFQGARVLDYKLVELKQGPNALEIPMTARLAPNFELSAAVMTNTKPRPVVAPDVVAPDVVAPNVVAPNEKNDDKPINRFHTASSPFTVQRELIVKLTTKPKDGGEGPIRPGDELEVTVTTTDPQGNPVAAEVSLAMVERSLLDRFAWPVVSIQEFFRGNLRESAVRTTSSVTFAYNPSTRPINPRLLAEEDRLEVAREEEASLRGRGGVVYNRISGLVSADAMTPPAVPPTAPEDGGRWGYAGGSEGGSSSNAHYARAPQSASGLMSGRGLNSRFLGAGQAGGVQLGGQSVRLGDGQMDFIDVNGNGTVSFNGGGPITVNSWAEVNGGTMQITANAINLTELANQQTWQVAVLDDSGSMQNLNLYFGTGQTHASAEALAAELAKTGAVLLPGMTHQETGYWNPAIETGADGKATVTFTVPERSTAWTLMAKGITTETLAGEATDEVVVKKELFGQMKLPLAFTDGDEAEVVASVHNDAMDQGQIQVTLKTTIAGRTVEEKQTVDVKAKGIHEVVFKAVLNRPEKPEGKENAAAAEIDVAFELTVTAGGMQDVARQSVPLRPYGMPIYATAGGSATSDTTAWVEAPKDMPLEDPALQILIGPTVEQSLLDIVLGPAPPCQMEVSRFTAGLESAASDLMASLALQKLVSATRDAGGPQAQALDGRVRASIGLLVSAQNDDGGWSWTGRGGGSQQYGSSRVVWALSLAKKAGYNVPEDTYNKSLGYLHNQAAATSNSDYESKAILLHALSAAGQGDFALANRLYRERPALSNAALVHLALAFAEMDRDPTAKELLDLLAERDLDDAASRRMAEQGCLPWSHSPTELRALYALGLQEVAPNATEVKELVDWLLAHRTGHRFSPDKATGPAAMALCRWFAGRSGLALTPGGGEGQGELSGQALTYKLAVFVNDVQAAVLDIDETTGTTTIDVPALLLQEGKQRINFQITGRGRYTYQCILGGFVRAEKLKSTTTDWEVRRTYEPAPLEVDGREIPRGFGVLTGSYSTFKNPLTQLPVGRRGLVELYVRREVSSNTPEQHLEYLVITEPIPSGTTVIEKSVTGSFERFEISPGAITFFIGSRLAIGTIRYELYGYLPGQYRAGPTVIRNAHRPEQLVVSQPQSLAVLPPGTQSTDKYRMTPQELYELGVIYFGKKDKTSLEVATGHLTELVTKWNLREDCYKSSVGMLLDAHLELGPAGQVVRYFEIIKEKWPAEEIPFDKILKVGRAYHDMGEYERSYLVFRATVEGSFMRESGVAGFLQAQGEFLRSVDVMGRLLREYPPEGYIASATYALSQRVYAKAPEAAEDEELRRRKVNRVDLVQRAWEMLENFLTAYPEDPAADQAAFSTANALLELKAYDQAVAACGRYAKRYPDSDLLDSYWYMIGYCHFATGEHNAALEMCRKVAEAMRIDKTTGREVEARNKWRAVYILGQVHHSLGAAAEAIAEYRRVEDRFPDARQSIDYFTRKAIELPEVSTVAPGEKAEVELEFRNIAACDAKVYRIDLMKFSLLKQNLGGITQINLAGIRPYHEATVELGDGKDYRDRTHVLPLPLKEEGAYLVVCRGDNLHASGLVLVTPLEVEVQEDVISGRVRTTVKDQTDDGYVSDVHVKVIGSHNNEFVSGETDLRGVFVADGIQGTSTVIAQTEGSRYAFFRGKTPLAVAMMEAPEEDAAMPAAQPSAQGKQMLLEGLQDQNWNFQKEQVDLLQKVYESDQKGVEAQKAF